MFAALAALSACTTVVQEPLDLDASRVEELRILDEDATSARLTSPAGWAEGGDTLFVTNRLTGARVSGAAAADGTLDVVVPGTGTDVFAVSLQDPAVDPPQITRVDGATQGAWGWGFGGEAGCEHGDFPVGEVLETPDAHGPDEHTRCYAVPSPTPDGAGHDVLAVGTSSLHLELLAGAVLRTRFSVARAGAVWVRVSATGADGHARVYEHLENFLDVEAGLWSTRERPIDAFVAADGVSLGAADVVHGLFFGPPPGHALDLQVDDPTFVFVRPTEAPL